MLAERFHLRTDQDGNLVGLPRLKPNQCFEVILLKEEPVTVPPRRRRPLPNLIGSVEIKGDLTEPVFTEEEWAEVETEWDEFYPLPDEKRGA